MRIVYIRHIRKNVKTFLLMRIKKNKVMESSMRILLIILCSKCILTLLRESSSVGGEESTKIKMSLILMRGTGFIIRN
jgi:hypothetical protein